ncbi:hypothetical protein [Streptomyces sp. NPDC093060]|uniref:hypothetical protein n=1 Tax=Streptomyces sp. NPDC093060 TaxID=3366019 RepID=UPI00382E6359
MAFNWNSLAPLTELLWSRFDARALAEIRKAEHPELVDVGLVENCDVSPFSLRGGMRSLELMIGRMENHWIPSGYYLIDEYANDMQTRERVGEVALRLPLDLGREIRGVLDDLDLRLWGLTVPDDEGVIVSQYVPGRDVSRTPWWWRRIPNPAPWDGM